MQLYRLFCEYDVGQEFVIFTTPEKAYEHARMALMPEFDDEFNWDMMMEEGLVWVDEVKVDP